MWVLLREKDGEIGLIQGLKRFDHISPVLTELHWLPYPQRVKYKVCMPMFKCLEGLAAADLVAFWTKGSTVSGGLTLRSAVRGDLVNTSYRTDWGLRAFSAAGPSGGLVRVIVGRAMLNLISVYALQAGRLIVEKEFLALLREVMSGRYSDEKLLNCGDLKFGV